MITNVYQYRVDRGLSSILLEVEASRPWTPSSRVSDDVTWKIRCWRKEGDPVWRYTQPDLTAAEEEAIQTDAIDKFEVTSW